MPKINLHTLPMQDASFFDLCYEVINLVVHNNINDVLHCDNLNLPIINFFKIRSYLQEVKNYLESNLNNKIIILDLYEGNSTVLHILKSLDLLEYYTKTNQIIIISSGNFQIGTHLNADCFLELTGSVYNQIIAINHFDKIYSKIEKPYNFLFLNKVARDHRINLINELKNSKLLEQALWSCHWEKKFLPLEYEDFFNNQVTDITINNTVHDLSWPDGGLFPQLYIDTYFSVVTETNFSVPLDYRTEKIYKPILIGHPFVAVSSYHFYQGLKNLGFKTFSGLIDETFDNILNDDDRITAITNTIKNLCASDLKEFLKEAKPICDYNRSHYFELIGKDRLTKYNSLIKFFTTI
jgi:hypothetical protein